MADYIIIILLFLIWLQPTQFGISASKYMRFIVRKIKSLKGE